MYTIEVLEGGGSQVSHISLNILKISTSLERKWQISQQYTPLFKAFYHLPGPHYQRGGTRDL